MRTNTRKFSLVLTGLVLVLTLGLAMVVPVLAACDCDKPMWVFFNHPALRAEITSPQEGDCIAVGSAFTVEVTVYNESDNCACAVDVDCVLNGGWPQGEYRDNLSFAGGETRHKSPPGPWPGAPIAANSSMVFTWQVVCTGPGDARIRINPSAMVHLGEAGTVTFHQFSLPFEVSIDIKPGSYPNSINLGSHGVIPVGILSSACFDATQVDPDTVELAGAGVAVRGKGSKYLAHEEDVNGDGLLDLVVKIETENLNPDSFQGGLACVTGSTFGGQEFEGCDEVEIVPEE